MSGTDAESLYARHRDLGPTIEPARDGVLEIRIESGVTRTLLRRLRDEGESAMGQLMDLTVVDRGPAEPCLDVVYWLRSTDGSSDLRVLSRLDLNSNEGTASVASSSEAGAPTSSGAAEPEANAGARPAVDSVSALWTSAEWLEREAFDLFGIEFLGHPDLRRLLLDPDFEGAPLRKSFLDQSERPLPVLEVDS